MKRGLSGRYETARIGGEEVRAFVPNPLPPDPPLELIGSRLQRLERAQLALGRLDGIAALLPDPHLFLYSYVRREAVLTSQIEGTQSSLSDLLLFELNEAPGVPRDDVTVVSNYVAALEHGVQRLHDGFPLSNRLIREMHSVLLGRGRGSDAAPGVFRHTQNWIGGTRPGNAHFVPPPPMRVENCMADLERFLHDDRSPYSTLIRAALAHAQFETIHPFLDGNGRIGRLLIAFILHHGGALAKPLLYLSLFFKEHRAEYYLHLHLVRLEGDWEAWLDFFLEGVELTAQHAIQTAQRLVARFEEDARRVHPLRGAASRVFDILRQRPIVTLTEVCRLGGVTFPTASKGMETLRQLGIVSELTGRSRNRVFVYDAYLAMLND